MYLDPPFKSGQDYNVLFAELDGTRSKAQMQAFEDTWHWDEEAARSYEEVVEAGGKTSSVMQAFRTFLGTSDMLAYLSMMAPRLVELHRVLKNTGSIYLHCDPAASHYLKLLLDAVFRPENFRSEIIWRRTGSHNSSKRFGPIHDVILFYAKDASKCYFRRVYRPYTKGHVESYFKLQDEKGKYWTNALTGAGVRHGESGKPWRNYNPTDTGRHWAIPSRITEELGLDEDLSTQEKLDAMDSGGFVDHPEPGSNALPTYRQYLKDSPGLPAQDLWTYQPHTGGINGVLWGTEEGIDEDVRWLVAQGDSERLGYQTQKPEGLLERIIKSSCPDLGAVLDPFCGCGTTIHVAQRFNRPWVGIDITQAAIVVIKKRLADAFGEEVVRSYSVIGEPVSVPDAKALATQDPYQFQWWALGLVGARPVDGKKGADKGIDGRLYFHDEERGPTKQVIFSVKAGENVSVAQVRDLRGVIEREKAQIGVMISMQKPTREMRKEAATAGFYRSPWGTHPRLQLFTIEELLEGKRVDYPPSQQVNATYRKARKDKARPDDQIPLE